jgi:hypothetical protein
MPAATMTLRVCRVLIFLPFLLSGCGGGANPPAAPVVTYPSSGNYAWLMPVGGASSAPSMGLSLIHPGNKTTQYVIEPTYAAVADVKVVNSGMVDVVTQTVSNIKPDSLLYIVAGEVRRLPLAANGAAPASRIKKTGNINACKFVIDANDYSNPDQSRFIVSTKGPDATCGTADDGQMIVALATNGGVSASPPLAKVLGVLGDFSTLVPSGWVLGDGILWSGGPLLVMRVNADPSITRVVDGSYKAVVAEYNNQLTVWKVTGNQLAAETKLNAVTTAGSNWQSIGHDATNFYVFQNSSNPLTACTTASTWKMLKISIATPAATQLATGAGCIASASMGVNVLYASVFGATANTLLSVDKAVGTVQTVQSGTPSDFISVLTSASGIHQMWLALNLTTSPSFTLKMIDETGVPVKQVAFGYPMGIQDAITVNLNSSENRTRFIYANGYTTSKAFGNSTIEIFDAASQATTALGVIPGFGTAPVFANVTSSSGDFIGGVSVPISAGLLYEPYANVFSLDMAVPNSITATTTKQ